MKHIFTTIFILLSCVAFSQKEPPGLIYTCEKDIDGKVQYDIYNSSGQKIIKQSVDWAYSNSWSWVFVMESKTKLRTAYNYFGEALGIDSLQESQSTYNNLPRVGLKRNGKWGFYDKQGKLKIAYLYDEISHFKNNIAAVKQGNDIFMIDTNGVKLTMPYDRSNNDYSFEDDDIAIGMGGGVFYSPDFIKVSENGKVGLLDVKNNKIIIPVEYDKLLDIKYKFKIITAEKNTKYGLLDFEGRVLIPLEYKRVFVLNAYFLE